MLSQQRLLVAPGTAVDLGDFTVLSSKHLVGDVENSGTDSEPSVPYALYFLRTILQAHVLK